ncbi:MAG: hypothetical protein AB1499_10805 [Nitrospirota bacterium]
MKGYRKVPEAAGTLEGIKEKIVSGDFTRRLKSLIGIHKDNNVSQPSFQALFGHYRRVLESSNRAVGIISDMNKRLSADSPADMTYVKNSYQELYFTVESAMENFDVFTHYRYMSLHGVLSRIDTRINLIINGVISGDLPERAHSSSAEFIKAGIRDKEKNILGHVAPLNLVDPMFDDFTPEGCTTIHDIIRFMHVMSVRQLAQSSAENRRPEYESFTSALLGGTR